MINDYVLFSPIGMTDPTRSNYDGPFLHILRQYRPRKAYIFMTKEICYYNQKDNRYEVMAKKLLPDCEIVKLAYPQIEKAHDFVIFDEFFRDELQKIKNQNPTSEILINISSGTPQIIGSLYLLAALLPFEVTLVQVYTPEKGSNLKCENYCCENEWDNLMDNSSDQEIENRSNKIIPDNVRRKILTENIISHINKYDYRAALDLVNSAADLFTDNFKGLLELANYRLALDGSNVSSKLKQIDMPKNDLFTVQTSGEDKLYEYILYLQIKLLKQELIDFTRGVSPIVADLFELYLGKIMKNPIDDWTEKRDGVPFFIRRKMPSDVLKYLDSQFRFEFRDSPVSTSNLFLIIQYYHNNNSNAIFSKIEKLRKFDEKVRNIAAHEIIGIDEEYVQKMVGNSFEQILDMIKYLFLQIFPKGKSNLWHDYDEMNQKLISYLK